MPRRILPRIRTAIITDCYNMTDHANDEMAEDGLTVSDVESAILNGRIVRIEKDDPRGTKYTIVGLAVDQEMEVGIVGRFTETGLYLIITVYVVTEGW